MSAIEVSSTGSLGFDFRSDERAYFNYPAFVDHDNVTEFKETVNETLALVGSDIPADKGKGTITRAVVRATMDTNTLAHLLQDSETAHKMEGAIDLSQFVAGLSEHIVYFANNHESRTPDTQTRYEFIGRVEKANHNLSEAHVRWDPPKEYTLTTQAIHSDELYSLWGGTFGWSREGCAAFADRLAANAQLKPDARSAWFKGLEYKGELIASAMAERLDIPSRYGQLALVEHTEWATKDEYRGRGLGQIVVKSLIDDIQSDLARINYLIYAECNILSGAHRVALRSGFVIPQCQTLPTKPEQILYQNVRVGDGLTTPYEYRNFLLLAAK